jgi:hypothetical protein
MAFWYTRRILMDHRRRRGAESGLARDNTLLSRATFFLSAAPYKRDSLALTLGHISFGCNGTRFLEVGVCLSSLALKSGTQGRASGAASGAGRVLTDPHKPQHHAKLQFTLSQSLPRDDCSSWLSFHLAD